MRKNEIRKISALLVFVLLIFAALSVIVPLNASAEEEQRIVTQYDELWTEDITVKVGTPVKWYVYVPEGVEPKGCGATIKIPDLGFGTDTHNKEEGHIELKQGENFIYEFTPEKTGDILFTCWMGSGCHYNYFHITEDGTYSIPSPEDPTDIKAVRDGADVTVSFKAPEVPEGSKIRGYKVIAVDDEGNRKKGTGADSPIILEGLDESKNYIITVTALGTSGKSKGENSYVLSAETVSSTASETEEKAEAAPESKAESAHEDTSSSEQILVTNYADLWASNITVKAGTHVKWYVEVPDSVEPKGCAATIKIPDLGFGTDTHNKNEGHIVLRQGRNFIYEFTPEKTGDILFTCWMGSGCHYNYIHVTADGIADPYAKTGGKADHSGSDASSKSEVSNERSTTNAASSSTNPDTGSESPIVVEVTVILCAVTVFASRKRKHMR